MSTISVTQLYEQLAKGMGKETAENLCSYINGKIKEGLEDQTKILATKVDIEQLRLATKVDIDQLRATTRKDFEELRLATKVDIDQLRAATKQDIAELRAATKEDIASLRMVTKEDMTAVLVKISENKAETMRWMFIFWVGQVAATFGLLMMFLKR